MGDESNKGRGWVARIKGPGIALVVMLGALLLLTTFCGDALVNRFSFFPEKGMQANLDRFDAPIEKVFLKTQDGVRISGFYLPREGAERTFLFFHGNAGNASHRLGTAESLWHLRANVLLMDYRGYGLSEGEPSEKGIYRDGEAGLAYLLGEKKIPLHQIFIFGRSIGTAVAVHISRERKVAGVILVCPISSGREAVSGVIKLFAAGVGTPFDSRSKIKSLDAPLQILHAEHDEILPIEMGRELHRLAEVDKEFVVLKGATHNRAIENDPTFFFSKVNDFVTRVSKESNGQGQ